MTRNVAMAVPQPGTRIAPNTSTGYMLPGRCGERVPEGLHPCSQAVRHLACSCVVHWLSPN